MTARETTASAHYRAMLNAGQNFTANDAGLPEVRLAIFSDHAVQQFAKVLSSAMIEVGLYPHLYLSDYGTANFEVFDSRSAAYGFKPDYAVYSIAVQKYRDRFFASNSAEREFLPQAYLQEVMSVTDRLRDAGISVVLNNFPLPIERMFGNYGVLSSQALYGSVFRFNGLLADAVAQRTDCLLNDLMYVANIVGVESFLDERLWHASKYLCANRFLPDVTRSIARMIGTRRGKMTKVIVLDLDNTIWGGVIGDDGLEGIALGGDAFGEAFQQFQRYILALRDRGYIITVCSKNNEAVALDAFRNHPEMILRENDVSLFVANWNDKASNIEYIARVLNLGLDSLVFIDDSPFERALVRSRLPQVAVPEMPEDVADYIAALELSGVFEGSSFTSDDATRNAKYREEALRTTEQMRFVSITDYLSSLDMVMSCEPFSPSNLPRVAQLIQRSNQFNLRTQRLTQSECESLAGSNQVTVAARLRDKFGDYGLIAVIACDTIGDKLFIKELVMSCRVLKRGVEEALMNYLFEQCKKRGLEGVQGQYVASAKNGMVESFFLNFEFNRLSMDAEQSEWYLKAEDYRPRSTQIRRTTIDRR